MLWGLWALFPKVTTQHIDPRSALFFQAVGAFAATLLVLVSLNFRPILHVLAVPLASLTGALGILGGLAYLYAVSRGPVGLVSVVTALYPLLTVALAHWFLAEPVTLRQGVGIVLALLAIVLIVG